MSPGFSPYAAALWKNLPVFQVFGANTDVGKTIFSTIFCKSFERLRRDVQYVKPVSTGPADEEDTRHVRRYSSGTRVKTLLQMEDPVSPHLAAKKTSKKVPGDKSLIEQLRKHVQSCVDDRRQRVILVETAGGVNSPGPSGTLQADLYRPLRLPSILIADAHLGGISTSISAYESLNARGYDVEGVAIFKDEYYRNFEYLQSYFSKRGINYLAIDPPPKRSENLSDDQQAMQVYYESACRGDAIDFTNRLLDTHENRIDRLKHMAQTAHKQIWWPFTQHQNISPESITTIDSAYGDYFQTYRSPDQQRSKVLKAITEANAVPIINTPTRAESEMDERSTHHDVAEKKFSRGIQSLRTDAVKQGDSKKNSSLLQSSLDGSASWWTQGLGHANPELTMAASYAAGRYGHVMFAEAIHEPALSLAASLLETVANPRLKRVFYSDNGSTGMEVATKMALQAASVRYGWNKVDQEVEILGLQGSYHGDTMGAMDMSEPSVYNEKVPWYKGRGFWFECPSVKMQSGKWVVTDPPAVSGQNIPATEFSSLQEVFEFGRDNTHRAKAYERHIRDTLERLITQENRRFGALVMETVVLGAGGMVLVDPLFQRVLTRVVRSSERLFGTDTEKNVRDGIHRWTGLPVVADEVFTGLYRLGHRASSPLLGILPDISVHAKLLTGGLVPLCATLASESIFEAFLADNKADALLHGHSYTAHPVGCAVADTTLKIFKRLDMRQRWKYHQDDWHHAQKTAPLSPDTDSVEAPKSKYDLRAPAIWSMWSHAFVTALSNAPDRIEGVWALGSVLAITFRDAEGGGYTSTAAKKYQRLLLDAEDWNVHSRVLGNVLYLMTSQTSKAGEIVQWEDRLTKILDLPHTKRVFAPPTETPIDTRAKYMKWGRLMEAMERQNT